MLQIVLCATRCPIVQQSALQLPYARFVNESAVALQFPFMQRFIQVSEFENFTNTNANISTGIATPQEPSGNCFLNADNALAGSGFEVRIDTCNFVEFQFNISTGLERKVKDEQIVYQKPIYYKIDNALFNTTISKFAQVESANLFKTPYALRFEVELPWNACGITSSQLLHSMKKCDINEVCTVHRKQKLQYILNGSNVSEKITYGLVDCERSKLTQKELQIEFEEVLSEVEDSNLYVKLLQNDSSRVEVFGPELRKINGSKVNGTSTVLATPGAYEIQTSSQTLTLTLQNGTRQYIKYQYKPGDVDIPFKTKAGEVCDIVRKGIFDEAKQAYLDSQQPGPDDPDNPTDPDKPTDPNDPNTPVDPNPGVPEEPDETTCEEGQKLVDGVCVDGVTGISVLLGALAGFAAVLL